MRGFLGKIENFIYIRVLKLPIFLLASFIFLSFSTFAQNKKVCIGDIQNKIAIGNLAGSRPLTFGFKNILQEYLEETNYDLVEDETEADYKINLDLLFFDVETTKSNISVFHKNDAETVLRIKAYLLDSKGKKIKDCIVTEKSSEISTSTLVIDEGGKMNQQTVSNVIKKVCSSAIKQLLIP